MARLFPFRPESPEISQEPRLVNLDDTTADEVFAALSSDTARSILSRLYEDPATASDVADAVDTSLQNARYHLDKLQDAGLIEDVDTWYSSRGTEMTVYAPTNEPLVVAAGREESTGLLRDALKRVLGSVGVLALASVFVDRLARTTNLARTGRLAGAGGDVDEAAGGGGGDGGTNLSLTEGTEAYEAATATPSATEAATPVPEDDAEVGVFDAPGAGSTETPQPAMETPTAAATETPVDDATTRTVEATREVERTTGGATSGPTPTPDPTPTATAADTGTPTVANVTLTDGGGLADAAGSLPPGLLFFAGGLLMIALGAGWWYAGRYRRGVP